MKLNFKLKNTKAMENNFSKVLLSFIAGAAAGTALGMLLAPDKGEITREKLRGSFDDFGEKARETYSKYKDKVQAKVVEEDDE